MNVPSSPGQATPSLPDLRRRRLMLACAVALLAVWAGSLWSMMLDGLDLAEMLGALSATALIFLMSVPVKKGA